MSDSSSGATWVIGTSGHVDHGKTSLVRALTGVDLDTRPEEQSRGITIALGFVPLDLPDGRRAALVDVPGHERLVRTMVAGATGIDAALLCISAQDGVMPQTKEHLAILDLLGIQQGIIAITKADLVDEELLELAIEEVQEEVQGTFLAEAPILPVSAVTGQGLDELRQALAALEAREYLTQGPFRLPVDRQFSRSGFGTVVTGTAWSGTLTVGDPVRLLPSGKEARVRGLQNHGEAVETVRAGWRSAINLSGVDVDDVPRGTVISSGHVPSTSMVDVQLQVLESAPELRDGASVRFLIGTAEAIGKLYVADDLDEIVPGAEVTAQIRLDEPVVVLPGDRFILRRTSPTDTIGGGSIIDPWAPRMRRSKRVLHGEQSRALQDGDLLIWLERAGESGLTTAEWLQRPGTALADVVQLSDRVFSPNIATRLEHELRAAIAEFHAAHPLQRGAGRRELLRGRLGHLPPKVFDALTQRLVANGALIFEDGIVRETNFSPVITPEAEALRTALRQDFTAAGLEGLTLKKLSAKHASAETEPLVRLMEHAEELIAVPEAGWIDAQAIATLRGTLKTYFSSQSNLDPASFKELTGLSRRVAIPLLEWMDRQSWTARTNEGRVAGPSL